MCFLPQWRALFEHLNFQKCSENGVLLACWLRNVHVTTPCTSTSKLPKVLREWCAVSMLTSKCVSRHSDVHFLNISTSKSASRLVCFVHFDFEMCFVPQWRALFEHVNFQKCCEHVVPQQHAMFDRSADPAPAALASLLFYLPSHKTLENTYFYSVSRFFYLFAYLHLPSDSFSSLIFFLLPFSFSDSSHLCAFPSLHIVGSLTSKVPSIKHPHSMTRVQTCPKYV